MPPLARAAAVAAAVVLLGGCAGDPPTAPPTGVDTLVVPTPSPDPADFVDAIDNPWLPLAAGSTWVYATGDGGTLTVTVEDDTREIAGVTTTEVRSETSAEDGEESVRWYAQDVAGNVWAFGEAGVWEAGAAGAEAGLAMPAEPRVGDGFEQQLAPGKAEDRARVVSLEGEASVPFGTFDGLLVTEQTSPLEPGRVAVGHHASGVGLVQLEVEGGGDPGLELEAFTAG